MEYAIILFTAAIGGSLVIGVKKNIWTRFAVRFLACLLVFGVLFFIIRVVRG